MGTWKKVLTATTSATDLVGSDGSAGQVLKTNGSEVLSWVDQTTGTTNLGQTQSNSAFIITSSTGTNVSLSKADTSNWGILSDDDWNTFNGKQDAITAGISDGNYLTANDAVADNDFLRINGTEVEGLTAAQTLSAIGAQAAGSYAALSGSSAQDFNANNITLANDLKLDGQGDILYNTAGTVTDDDIFQIGPAQATSYKNLKMTYNAVGTSPKTTFYGVLQAGGSGATGAYIKGITDGNLNLWSDVDVNVRLDSNQATTASNAKFIIKNGSGTSVFEVDETGNVQLDGDLTVTGQTITTATEVIEVNNNTIIFNADNTSSDDFDSGIVIERGGNGDNALLYWDEGDDKWKFGTNDDADLVTSKTEVADIMQIRIDGGYNDSSEEVPVGHMQYHGGNLYLRTA